MKEVYRIKKGTVSSKDQIIAFDFGLIFEDDGMFYFDFYVYESFNLNSFLDNKDQILFHNYFMSALTDENNEIEATQLSIKSIYPMKSLIKMKSYGYLRHKKIQFNNDNLQKETKNQTLFYLEIEGLKMEYSNLTETIRARSGVKIKDYNNWVRDHTEGLLIYDSPTKDHGCNNFLFTFFQGNNNSIYVQLPNYLDNGANVLYYDVYKEFKRELISLLSFLNGAEVEIRKEFIGGFYNFEKVDSQTVITYSFKTIKNESYNEYIPLNNGFHRGDNILNNVFIHCFNKYVTENKKLDLNSIIFYLNGAEQVRSLEEKIFIQIIAFERLAQKLVENLNEDEILILPDQEYQPIKIELLQILEKYKLSNAKAVNSLKGKIGELHKTKKTSTKFKFIKLLEYANIALTPDIEHIIDEVRHRTIHHGEIGGNQGLRNFLVLDQLLRDIILNIIGYSRARISHLE